jgi:glutathione S-transferase
MKLFMHAAACSLSPHIVCRELGLPIQLVAVDTKTHRTAAGDDYLQINGLGYVPALQLDDASVITEGPAIVQYLADLAPDAGLAPRPGTRERLQLQSWLNFLTSELHKPLAMLMHPDFAAARAPLVAKVGKRLDWLTAQLAAHAGPFIMGSQFTVADPYLFVVLNWTPLAHVELARWPALLDFQRRIAARPAVQAALEAEQLRNVPGTVFFAPEALLRARSQKA